MAGPFCRCVAGRVRTARRRTAARLRSPREDSTGAESEAIDGACAGSRDPARAPAPYPGSRPTSEPGSNFSSIRPTTHANSDPAAVSRFTLAARASTHEPPRDEAEIRRTGPRFGAVRVSASRGANIRNDARRAARRSGATTRNDARRAAPRLVASAETPVEPQLTRRSRASSARRSANASHGSAGCCSPARVRGEAERASISRSPSTTM